MSITEAVVWCVGIACGTLLLSVVIMSVSIRKLDSKDKN